METAYGDIFTYIKSQEKAYQNGIQLIGDWNWSMKDHIETSILYKNSQLRTGKSDFKPVKNITRPILNLQYRTEDIEVKDVELYVNDPEKYYLSFLVKKYHDDVFVVENDIDTFFDELNVSRVDFGGGLSKQLNKPCPEVTPLESIAFCDQTDILSGPIGLKHFYSPDQLLDMETFGWGKKSRGATISVPDLITLSRSEKQNDKNGTTTQTPGRYIEIYEVHGNLPKRFANPSDTSGRYETRIFIVGFYQKKWSQELEGVILYTAPELKTPFKLVKRDPVYGRALGFGGAEELFEPQVWVNYDMIRMQQMLDAAAKTILKTTDPAIARRNSLQDVENLEIIELAAGTDLSQVDTFPRNLKLFDDSVARWEAHAQQMGAANDAILGESPSSGTPFKLQELVTSESHGLHDYRRGQFAKHLEEIYKDWIIPHIEKKITEGSRFLSELSLDELQYVADSMITCQANDFVKEKILSGDYDPTTLPQEKELYMQQAREQFKKKGNKHFIEILKGEFKGYPLAVKVNIAGKQKNLAQRVDKLTNIFRQIIANPSVLQIPALAKVFNDILEGSGFSPADFSGITKEQIAATQPQGQQTQGASATPSQPSVVPQTQNAY